MESNEALNKIKEYIGKGHTEKAIEAFVKYTKESGSHMHDEAILLSGQFRQWKRENMLGVEQPSSELRRIEMSMMDLLQGKLTPDVDTSKKDERTEKVAAAATTQGATAGSNKMPLIAGGIALLAIVLAAWYFMGSGGDKKSDAALAKTEIGDENTGTNSSGDTKTASTSTPSLTATNTGSAKSSSALDIKPGESLELDKNYLAKNGKYFLRFQSDGNLCVKKAQGENYVWGSFQAGAPLSGKSAIMQTDGHLCIYDGNKRWVWGTQTTVPNSTLAITDEGVLQVVAPDGKIIWASK